MALDATVSLLCLTYLATMLAMFAMFAILAPIAHAANALARPARRAVTRAPDRGVHWSVLLTELDYTAPAAPAAPTAPAVWCVYLTPWETTHTPVADSHALALAPYDPTRDTRAVSDALAELHAADCVPILRGIVVPRARVRNPPTRPPARLVRYTARDGAVTYLAA